MDDAVSTQNTTPHAPWSEGLDAKQVARGGIDLGMHALGEALDRLDVLSASLVGDLIGALQLVLRQEPPGDVVSRTPVAGVNDEASPLAQRVIQYAARVNLAVDMISQASHDIIRRVDV